MKKVAGMIILVCAMILSWIGSTNHMGFLVNISGYDLAIDGIVISRSLFFIFFLYCSIRVAENLMKDK